MSWTLASSRRIDVLLTQVFFSVGIVFILYVLPYRCDHRYQVLLLLIIGIDDIPFFGIP